MTARIITAVAAILWTLPAATQTTSGSIQGQVIDEKTGAPVRFATVALLGPGAPSTIAPASIIPVGMGVPIHRAEVAADEQGRFTFKDVAPGTYAVSASHDGYSVALYGPTRAARALVPVKDSERVTRVALKMRPCGVIAGKVLNEKGEPVQNAELVALRYYYGAWMWRPAVTPETPLKAFSNDLGEFRISNLTEGSYIVRAAAPRHAGRSKVAPLTYPAVFYPNALNPEDAQPVSVASGAVSQAEFRLSPGPAYQISGTIDSSGSDQPVCFGLNPKSYNSSVTQVTGRVARFTNDGQFVIDDVPPGSYVLSAALCNCRGEAPLGAIQAIDVAGNVDGLKIQLSGGQSLSGVVKGEGVDTSAVKLVLYSPELLPGFVPRTPVGADGTFTFQHVLPRHHIVGFSGLPAGAYVKSVKYGGREVPATGFLFDADSSLEVTLSSQGSAQLTGTVFDKSGAPAAYAMVMALPTGDGAAESAKDVMADEKGNYVFPAMRPGTYKVLAWEDRYNPIGVESADPGLPAIFAANARPVSLSAGAAASVTLPLNTEEDVYRARAAARMTPPKNP
jgi:hypothetical protein